MLFFSCNDLNLVQSIQMFRQREEEGFAYTRIEYPRLLRISNFRLSRQLSW